MGFDLLPKVFGIPGLGLVCQEAESSRAHGFSTSQSRLARSRGRNYLTQKFTDKICTSSSHSVRFCQIGYTYWLLSRWSKMIQDDQDDQDVQCPSVSQCNGSFRCSLCSRLNSARPQRLQLAVRYESWLDDKRLDVTPDLRLEIRNSNEFRIIRIIGISKKS